MSTQELVSVIIPTYNRQKDVNNCVASLLKSDYQKIEIIVVDNGSSDKTVEDLEKNYSKDKRFQLVKSKVNLGAGGGRNRGSKEASGKYLLFVDSDNVVEIKMISYLIDFFENKGECGMVGPLMYNGDHKTIWTYFADINMSTSQAKYKGTGEKNIGQVPKVVPVGHLPNCFMVLNSDFTKIGGFEERYVIVYEEADLAEKIKRLGKKIYLYSKAITYHVAEAPKESDANNYGFRSPERAFLLARNRVLFMKRNATFPQKVTFFIIFNPLICLYYQFNLLRTGQSTKAWAYLKGNLTGLFY